MFHIIKLATTRADPAPGQGSSIVLPSHVSSYCEPQLACPAINQPNRSAYHVPFATQSLVFLQPTDQTGQAIIRLDKMTQVDPQATIPRLAGGFEMTCPAGRPVYLPSLHVTSGGNHLEHSTSTVISLSYSP